ncbi:hypothetical protein K491DRAFT_701425 [Lophiostoma macrostomum CBS 122681]|uniref:SWIM-type domain-containing protein n=1 Tax=Lophiostoma macrostomum CBS 122681 TaxID=1314788 RepID=A0A6A6TM17_9PLEO|nr:hypothetical protein K491DRAFT_701425 [Lophiostoma macrostomum CBS 122681]
MAAPSTDLPSSRAFVTQLLNSLHALPPPSVGTTNNAASNHLISAPEAVKKQLLTLHVLFPNEFLPALDLLDRHLVTRFRIRRNPDLEEEPHRPRNSSGASHGIELEAAASRESGNGATTETSKDAAHLPQIRDAAETGTGAPQRIQNHSGDAHAKEEADTVYYVRSAQQRSSRYGSSIDSSASYEVRLRAWNCSCPAFAFSAFPSTHPEPRALEVAFDDALRGIVDAVGGDMQGEREEAWSFGGAGLGTGMPPVCKHLLACVLVERCPIFSGFVEGRDVSVEEAAGWAAGWGD